MSELTQDSPDYAGDIERFLDITKIGAGKVITPFGIVQYGLSGYTVEKSVIKGEYEELEYIEDEYRKCDVKMKISRAAEKSLRDADKKIYIQEHAPQVLNSLLQGGELRGKEGSIVLVVGLLDLLYEETHPES